MAIVAFKNMEEFSHAKKESLRAIKTNIQFCGDDIKTIMFTSSLPDEGKSTIAYDLAVSFTDSGKKVLLLDTDMRGSVMVGHLQAKLEGGKKIAGLSHYLSGQKALEEVLYETTIPNLSVIFAGPSVPNPTEILDKQYFAYLIEYAREHFDYILIDCAPLGAVIDAAVVAKYCDGAVIVIAQGIAGSRMINNTKRQLEATGIKILGAIINKVKQEKHHYGKYYGRYYGKYYGRYYGGYYGNYYDETEGNTPTPNKGRKKGKQDKVEKTAAETEAEAI
jgi:capsular exopolysaccharide synthesis family protein